MGKEMYECTVWLYEEDYDRLMDLIKNTGYSKSAIVSEALKIYEEKVIADESNKSI